MPGFWTLVGLSAALAVGGCSTTALDVPYRPAAGLRPAAEARPLVTIGAFTDGRGEPPTYLGTIRGGFGNPLKTLETPAPVSEVVREAYADGLAARGLLAAAPAPYTLTGTVQQFDVNQLVRREATARVLVTLVEAASGRTVLSQPHDETVVSGNLITFDAGLFASVEDLRDVAAEALRLTVDETLDDARFRAALR